MMDRLKCRVWDEHGEKYLTTELFNIACHKGVVQRNGNKGEISSCIVDQCIGLRDSKLTKEYPNGQLIFASDIVKMAHYAFECYCTSRPCECSTISGWTTGVVSVTISNGVVLNKATFIDDEGEYSKRQGRVQMYVNRQKYVIGNIRQNPDLLN